MRYPISNWKWCIAAGAVLLLGSVLPARAQEELPLWAKARVFTDAPVGINALKALGTGEARQYYVLAGRGTTIAVYDTAGKRVAEFPPPLPEGQRPSKGALLQYGEDLDAACPKLPGAAPDAKPACFLYVADRGANAIKVLTLEGALVRTIPVTAPTSVAALAEGEAAVATMRNPHLVTVFNRDGTLVREFGVPAEITDTPELNRFLNIGHLATDAASYLYYAFSFLPEPTVRKYDRFGYAAMEMQLTTLDIAPASEARRRAISRLEDKGARSATFEPVVGSIGVDPETQEIWLGVGGLLMHFTADGTRVGLYRLFTKEGARIQPTAILVEPDRLLIGTDTLGVFEFARPDKSR